MKLLMRRQHTHGGPRRRAWALARAIASACLMLLSASMGMGEATALQSPPSSAAAPAAVPAFRQANTVAILTVHTGDSMIDRVTLMSLERRMKKAVADGADAVVLDIDTLGGEVPATLDICNLLKDRGDTPANVVAWINPKAFSAGTFLALACREIVVAPGSTFGDAAPVHLLGHQLSPTERAKVLAPLQSEIIDSARRNHYDEKLVQAFIMLGQELWMIENTSSGERIFVDRAEYKTVFGAEPPQQMGQAMYGGGSATVVPWIGQQNIPRDSDHAALDPEQLKRQTEFEQTLPPVRAPLTEAERGNWKLIMQVTDGSTLLTLKPDQAIYYGLATSVVANDADLKAYFGAQTLRRYDQTWSEGLVRFLVSWPVKLVLIVIFLVCLFVELAMPGFGVFGAAAVIALLMLIGAPALAGMAQWWDILLIVLGLVLVAAELFVVPGIGLAGVGGVLALLIGLVGTFVGGDLQSMHGQRELWTGLATTLVALFVGGVVIWFLSRQFHSLPFLDRVILRTELKREMAGGGSARNLGLLEAMGHGPDALKAGDLGRAETDLRPAGRATFGGRLLDVQSVGTYIEKGTPVRVISVGRYVIEVEEASA